MPEQTTWVGGGGPVSPGAPGRKLTARNGLKMLLVQNQHSIDEEIINLQLSPFHHFTRCTTGRSHSHLVPHLTPTPASHGHTRKVEARSASECTSVPKEGSGILNQWDIESR